MKELLIIDIKHGCIEQWKKYFIIICITFYSCVVFWNRYYNTGDINNISCADMIFFNLKGMKYIKDSSIVIIPDGFWLALNMFLSLLIGNYPIYDMKLWGQQKFIHLNKKSIWWKSKCVWCMISVLIYYFIIITVSIFSGIIFGDGSMTLHQEVTNRFSISNNISINTLVISLMVMILISCILSEFKMLISVIAGAVWGYIFNAIVLINAVYTKSDYALGNFLMLIRVYSMDINIVQIIILWCICFIFVLWIGTIIIKRKDLKDK